MFNLDTENKKTKAKIIIAIVVAVIIIFLYVSNSVPNIIGVQESVAISTLTNKGYIPVVEYENSDAEAKGCVTDTYPRTRSLLAKGKQITVYVSKGSISDNNCKAQNSVIQWRNIYQSTKDDWNLYTPYIRNNYLYIETNMQLNSSMSVILRGFGTASINDTYDKSVPIKYEYESSNVKAGEFQKVTIQVPLSDLNNQKPTTLYCKLATYVGGMQKDIDLIFNITW